MVGSILLYPDMERPSLYFLKFFCSVLFDTTSRTVGRLNEPAPGSAHRESIPSEDLSELPPLLDPGFTRDHCETGCHARFWLNEFRSAPYWPFIDIGVIPMQVVFAHPPHRCSPSPGDRQLTLFVTGYSVFDVHKKILFFSHVYGKKLAS